MRVEVAKDNISRCVNSREGKLTAGMERGMCVCPTVAHCQGKHSHLVHLSLSLSH